MLISLVTMRIGPIRRIWRVDERVSDEHVGDSGGTGRVCGLA